MIDPLDTGDSSCALYDHGEGDIEVVAGVAAPYQTEVIAELADADGAAHGPEMRQRFYYFG